MRPEAYSPGNLAEKESQKIKLNHLSYNKLSGWKDYSGNFF
jgi:hypothetical protein